jgi:predicted aldo/keto reductase-like oxidoreductase
MVHPDFCRDRQAKDPCQRCAAFLRPPADVQIPPYFDWAKDIKRL